MPQLLHVLMWLLARLSLGRSWQQLALCHLTYRMCPCCCCCTHRAGALVPKTPSAALYLELLDAAGAPTWMARDVQQLVRLAKADQPAQQQPPQRPDSVAAEQRHPAAAGAPRGDSNSDSDADEASDGSDEEGKQQQTGAEDDVDVDTLLAMAAAEVGVGLLGCVPCQWRDRSPMRLEPHHPHCTGRPALGLQLCRCHGTACLTQ